MEKNERKNGESIDDGTVGAIRETAVMEKL